MAKIAIIGGSGLEKSSHIESVTVREVNPKWGAPSSPITEGVLNGVPVAFLSRHGFDHSITPSHVNNRANIAALKEIGCTHILSSTAVGSLREEIHPGHLVIPDQFIDFTKQRVCTYYDDFKDGIKHISVADPFNEALRQDIIHVCEKLKFEHHTTATVVTIEGPRFSTRAESQMFRILGADIINMSIAPEAVLAAELGIPYATIAMSTDYDAWRVNIEPVSWEEIKQVMEQNTQKVQQVFAEVVSLIASHNK